jgi:hypothetical protein
MSVLEFDPAISLGVECVLPSKGVVFASPLFEVVDDDGRDRQNVRNVESVFLIFDLCVGLFGHPVKKVRIMVMLG